MAFKAYRNEFLSVERHCLALIITGLEAHSPNDPRAKVDIAMEEIIWGLLSIRGIMKAAETVPKVTDT